MSQMGVTIDGRPADVHTDVGGMKRLKALLLPRQRIIYDQFRFHYSFVFLLNIFREIGQFHVTLASQRVVHGEGSRQVVTRLTHL